MLQAIFDFLFGASVGGVNVIMAIDPVTAMTIASAGSSLLGGLLSSKGNQRQQVETPQALTNQMDELQNPNYFLDSLMKAVNNDQGAYNVNASLAARGVDSPLIASEQRQAMESDRQNAVVEGMNQLESTRLGMLNNLIGQQSQINTTNAQLDQQHNQNRLGIINETVSGIGGSVVQGLGAKINQQNFDRLMNSSTQPTTGMQGGVGFNSNTMFDDFMNPNNSGFLGMTNSNFG